jgi:putative salt-induced outer membrane protein YdiY
MNQRPRRLPLSALALLVCSPFWTQAAASDAVVTTNGDRLTGTILNTGPDYVLLRTPYAGVLRIDRNQVRSLHRGTDLGGSEPTETGTETATGGAESKPAEPTTAATPTPAGADLAASTTAAAATTRSSPYIRDGGWSGRVNFALSDENGNSKKSEIDFDYQLNYTSGWHRLRSFGALEFDSNNSDKTKDKWSTFNQYSRLFPSRWYGAAWVTLEHDRFSDLRLRTLGGPAVGYLAFEGDALTLTAEAGPALLLEDFYGQPDNNYGGAAWFLTYEQLVWNDLLQPYHRQFGFVAVDDDKQLWQSWTGVRVPLAGGFTGAVEFEYDYDSRPAIEAKTTDTTVRLKLGYEW